MIYIAPSILSANFAKLGEELTALTEAGADMIHIDVVDGHFASNITIGPAVIKAIRDFSNIPFYVHLMITNPATHIKKFAEAGADMIIIHYESHSNILEILGLIKDCGCKCGISIMPSTPIDVIEPFFDKIDLISIMTVMPGFAGQNFMCDQLSKISDAAKLIRMSKQNLLLEVDGGINNITAGLVIKAGANILVSGSYVFKSNDFAANIRKLREE